ncbi:hypothetical protein GGTG_06610 [Gaeumannomyces tritici R3-111a-1]|uniref:Uncharacterized protein n=1 Tax=Gaeumannomyces tritici (strain R3-111a-1) TaxID=644352 RepID=J3NZB1_GAET3|nr:hypothetical protein GGTG_06610 [Gaeumannomyces tritici R3-111a-1]EJT76694.1 hypothetical protein GGTG_06610 [Gaeumannomyces tritici R3-111a-1]
MADATEWAVELRRCMNELASLNSPVDTQVAVNTPGVGRPSTTPRLTAFSGLRAAELEVHVHV